MDHDAHAAEVKKNACSDFSPWYISQVAPYFCLFTLMRAFMERGETTKAKEVERYFMHNCGLRICEEVQTEKAKIKMTKKTGQRRGHKGGRCEGNSNFFRSYPPAA
ncbi:hypothetical protein POVWA2_039370 [Plasmodium ovale wallikeri]|uniref:Uncharacterized protein n=1 Tax=Plasmodium ovale wallikeri TaxID=864142 RepID=A0A1A8Z794_PLAOA|nr:hypothetical protein POVWA1_040610 [Plasmodium ovale wallikeri]SBT40272.1 hypothetical protein POVWA2_039370 [Plasmodium ovale wallikeri]